MINYTKAVSYSKLTTTQVSGLFVPKQRSVGVKIIYKMSCPLSDMFSEQKYARKSASKLELNES